MIYSVPELEYAPQIWVLHKHFSCSYQYLSRLAEFRELFQGFYHQGLIWLWSIFALKLLIVHKGNTASSNYDVLTSEKYHSERCHRNFQHKVDLCNRIPSLHEVRKFGRHIFNVYGQSKLQTDHKRWMGHEELYFYLMHIYGKTFKGHISACPVLMFPVSLVFVYLYVSFS